MTEERNKGQETPKPREVGDKSLKGVTGGSDLTKGGSSGGRGIGTPGTGIENDSDSSGYQNPSTD